MENRELIPQSEIIALIIVHLTLGKPFDHPSLRPLNPLLEVIQRERKAYKEMLLISGNTPIEAEYLSQKAMIERVLKLEITVNAAVHVKGEC